MTTVAKSASIFQKNMIRFQSCLQFQKFVELTRTSVARNQFDAQLAELERDDK